MTPKQFSTLAALASQEKTLAQAQAHSRIK